MKIKYGLLVILLCFASNAFSASFTITWVDNLNSAHDGYQIERMNMAISQQYFQVGSTNATTMTFVDSNLPPGYYCYRVRAYKSSPIQFSPYSNEACGNVGFILAPPDAPQITPGP